ncbi:aldolase/citrate lyase family protein [Archangium violaceum]|uniref:aldolase/citrate lyase family protein n=1 Tax=Archangium violaceum TaxID=83451 RepID=UPI002B30B7F2|nr:aldolase/citrate lyase family protein [Archangium gephyra]
MTGLSQVQMAPSGWRSLLFIPQFAFARATRLAADCFIIDLQDAVPLAAKAAARASLVEAMKGRAFAGRPVVVRINEAGRPELLEDDLRACIGLPGLTALMPTLISSPEELDALHVRVSAIEEARGLSRGSTRFLPLIETPAAVLNAGRIALAGGGRNLGLVLGHGDLFRFTGATPHAELTLSHPRSVVVMAARAAGIEPFDTPYTKPSDRIGLELHASEGRLHGFTGKCCVHPDQLETVNRCMTPTAAEQAWARRVTEAQEQGALATLTRKVPGLAVPGTEGGVSQASGTEGMAIVDGQLIGPPHLKAARRMLALVPSGEPAADANTVVRGRRVTHSLERPPSSDDRLPNPYELTASMGMRDLWVQCFYSHDRIVTSAPFAARLGLTTPDTLPLPFMMGLYLACCMSSTHGAIYHLGFRNARQLAPLRVGDSYRQEIQVRQVRNTGDGRRAVVTTHRRLVRVGDDSPVFSLDKLELYHRQPESFPASVAAARLDEEERLAAMAFRAALTRRAGELPPSVRTAGTDAGTSFEPGELLLHSFARPLGISANLALSTQFLVTHPIHLDHHRFDLGHGKGVVVSGGLVVAMTLAAAARDLYEVVWEELLAADNLRPVAPTQTVGALSYVLSRAPVEGMDALEELVVRTLGVLELTPSAELADVPLPRALFTLEGERPSAYDEFCRHHGLHALEGRVVCVATRRILRIRG